jgi:hypothetical protein
MGDAITNPSPPIRKIIQAIIVKAMPEAAILDKFNAQ